MLSLNSNYVGMKIATFIEKTYIPEEYSRILIQSIVNY